MKKLLTLVLLPCLLVLYSSVNHAASARLLDMRVMDSPGNEWQLIFDLSDPIQHRLFTLDANQNKPHRVVIDFNNTRLVRKLGQPSAPGLRAVRSAARDETDLRVVLDMQGPVSATALSLPPAGRYGHRLVVKIIPKSSVAPAAPILRAAAPRQAAPAAPAYRPLPQSGSKKGRDIVIAVDAGHGGMDPGAIGAKGTYEKHVAMAVAKNLAHLINQADGLRAVLIRDGDYYLSLRERTRRARAYQADVFISIHADAYKEKGRHIRGSSVYMLSQRGASSEAAKWLAEKENSADLLGGVSLSDKDDVLASVLLDLSQNGTLEASAFLGKQALGELARLGPVHHRKVQQAAFIVLKSPDIPSILIETGFISNPDEERKLNDKNYRQQLARAIVGGLQAYFQRYAPPGTAIAHRYGLLARQ